MGIAIALLGTILVWLLRISEAEGPVWPSVLATIGFWALGVLLHVVRRNGRVVRRGYSRSHGTGRPRR